MDALGATLGRWRDAAGGVTRAHGRRWARDVRSKFLTDPTGIPVARLGRYELLARIAAGGMGEIFLARLEGAAGFEKLFVIKRILPHLAGDLRFRAMLIGEARIAANMSHANICQVYELGENDRQLYIVMEYLEGVTILALLRKYSREKRQLPLGFIAGVVHQVAEGLHYAHELRDRSGELMHIIHRDVTPSNLFLTESGVAKVHDFGVAKAQTSASTESGTIKGKFAYMAPEQLTGAKVDRRADIFALGVVISEMISIRRLFQRKTDYLTFQAVMEQPLPDFRRHRPELPEAAVPVLSRALARDPAERYATVRELATAITDALGRPWSQAEISELVCTDFREELRHRHSEVAGAVNRSAVRTAPVILESPQDPDAEDHFAYESSVDHGRTQVSQVTEAAVADAVSSPHRRPSVRWRSIAAIGAGAAAAVLLVVIVIHALRSPSNHDAPIAQISPPATLGRATAAGVASHTDPYSEAIHAHDARLARCVAMHDEPLPEGTRGVVRVGADGHALSVSFTPPQAEHSALTSCIRDVLAETVYPAAKVEQELALAVHR